jgi:Skp family chaperone for outer membrane proteins
MKGQSDMQRTPLVLLALALVAAVIALAGESAYAAPAANDHRLAIGVVKTLKILRAMHESKKLEDDIRAKAGEFDNEQKQRTAKLQEMQKQRDETYKPGSQQWTDQTMAIDKADAELQVWTELRRRELDRMRKDGLKSLFDHMGVASAEVAQQLHLDLVIADQSPDIGPDMEKVNVGQLQALLAARAVLYADKNADITEEVLTRVEANFKSSNPSAGPAQAIPNPTGSTGSGPAH